MPYITREDGERFIIPSYRDVLSAKKPALMKKEVLLLSSNYGEYVTLQRKNIDQYEAAFSPDAGYLLGESVWHYFKRPRDMIYCEAIPNTSEAILVIVKAGSVYLDGSFPIDSIPDELIVFRTQQNSFEIYIHGNIPISEKPEEGKFTLDESSIKSFTYLPEPIFPTLSVNKAFQLRLVDSVLKTQGIGVLPVKQIVLALVLVATGWLTIKFFLSTKKEIPSVFVSTVINPYQSYLTALSGPAPVDELEKVTSQLAELYTIPGWYPVSVAYGNEMLQANVKSLGIKTNILFQWASQHAAQLQILPDGVYLSLASNVPDRGTPDNISPLQEVIAELLDRLSTVTPGNNLTLGSTVDRGRFSEITLTIAFANLSLNTMNLLAEQLRDLPLILTKVNITLENGNLNGTILLKALGN